MDRFIDAKGEFTNYFHKYLKSNMDRFIAPLCCIFPFRPHYLKSNMDRFIVNEISKISVKTARFKIQYG